MKFNSKLIILAAMFVGLCIILWLLRGRIKDAITIHDVETVIELKDKPVNHWIDANGKDHATKELAQVSSQAALIGMKSELDKQAKLLKIRPKDIRGFGEIAITDTGRILAYFSEKGLLKNKVITLPGGKTDTVERYFEWIDNWTWMEGLVGKNTVQIDYKFDDTLTHTEYVKRKWFLGKQTLYMDASLQNPNAYIRGMTGIRINDKMPGRINIGPYIGYGAVINDGMAKMGISFGISIQYAVIRF